MFNILQTALQRYLALDPETPKRLQALAGKRVLLELRGINLSCELVFADGTLQLWHSPYSAALHTDYEKNNMGENVPDTIISGTPLRLLHMTLAPKSLRKQFFADDITITGDLDLGQHVIDLFDQLEIDWEEPLSRIIGDAPAYQFSRVLREVTAWGKETYKTLLTDVNEFVHEEIPLFPAPEAMQDFFHDVDQTRMDADRLAARMQHLAAKIKG
jgi:ubiquinone biosynthesis protein UbiJ